MAKNRVLVLNGANLNMLGVREPHIYGTTPLAEVDRMCHERAEELGLRIECRQSNHEGVLIDWIHDAYGKIDGIVFNPGGYGRTSISIYDALVGVQIPTIELHIGNIYTKESWRPPSYLSRAAKGIVVGFGIEGYPIALDAMARMLKKGW